MLCAFALATPCCARDIGGWAMAMNTLGDNEKKGDTTC